MSQHTTSPFGAILHVDLARAGGLRLAEQVYDSVRRAIEGGQLLPGAVLPSSRSLADDLHVSRSTITLAYEHLRREGYIESARGRVSRVALHVPHPPPMPRRLSDGAQAHPPLSARSRHFRSLPDDVVALLVKHPRAFRPGIPALDVFPMDVWQRLRAKAFRRMTPQSLAYGDVLGYAPLRHALAAHLRAARGLACTAETVVICNGTQQALDLAARLLVDEGDCAWVEDPGHPGARLALEANGVRVVPVPVDEAGLDVDAGRRSAPDARLAFVTPARQLPLGATMSDARRHALLAWASSARAWVLEDDYDSELRYASRPVRPLQAIDTANCVVLAGSFSKVMLPALRMGYMVIPPALVEPLRRLRMAVDLGNPVLPQAVMADFIAEGHFARHIRRMQTLYGERHNLLVSLLQERLSGALDVKPVGAGVTLPVWLKNGIEEEEVSRLAPAYDLDLRVIGAAAVLQLPRGGLMLGFASLTDREIREGVDRLERLLTDLSSRRRR